MIDPDDLVMARLAELHAKGETGASARLAWKPDDPMVWSLVLVRADGTVESLGRNVARAVLPLMAIMTLDDRIALFAALRDEWCPDCGSEQDPRGCTCRRDD